MSNPFRNGLDSHRPHPLSDEVGAEAKRTGENVNLVADREAVLAAPIHDLPAPIAKVRAKLDAIEEQRAQADLDLRAAMSKQDHFYRLTQQIAERRQRLSGNVARQFLAQSNVANATENLKITLQNEKNFMGQNPIAGMINSLVIDRELAALLPALNNAEELEIQKLESAAGKLARECGLS